jgi:cysteinyl-tRNA synthetase
MSFFVAMRLLGFAEIELLSHSVAQLGVDKEEARELDSIVLARLTALADKNFAEADRIRDELAAQGIQLMDDKDPETGERRTRWEVKR